MTQPSKQNYKCEHCDKEFRKESTFLTHTCEGKRRWLQRDELGVKWAFMAYQRFYEIAQPNSKIKDYKDFMKSPYYLAFVRFGRYCVDVKAINFESYLNWNLDQSIRIDDWNKDSTYGKWLSWYLLKEPADSALERSIKHIQERQLEYNFVALADYFRWMNPNIVCNDLSKGKISPWIIFHSTSGQEFLEKMSEDHVKIFLSVVDLDKWNIKFRSNQDDVQWCKQIFKQAQM